MGGAAAKQRLLTAGTAAGAWGRGPRLRRRRQPEHAIFPSAAPSPRQAPAAAQRRPWRPPPAHAHGARLLPGRRAKVAQEVPVSWQRAGAAAASSAAPAPPPRPAMEAGQGPGGGEVGDPAENSVPKPYVPTEEERQLLKECGEESARYRAFPLAAVSMLATSLLIRKGVLRDNSRFGSLTKVAFAGTCGYLAGKISYLPICSEKFKKLKDSPIGDVLRQAQRHSSHNRSSRKSEFSDIPSQSFTESSSQRPGSPLSPSYSDDYSSTDRALSSYEPVPFSASLNESSPTGITDYTVQDPAPVPEESRKKKGISYEELRNKHRETYEVMLPPKAETPIKFSQEKPVKEVKVNKYGDTWDE